MVDVFARVGLKVEGFSYALFVATALNSFSVSCFANLFLSLWAICWLSLTTLGDLQGVGDLLEGLGDLFTLKVLVMGSTGKSSSTVGVFPKQDRKRKLITLVN